MRREPPAFDRRLKEETLHGDLVVIGGGLAGICASLTAARAGLSVILIHDRPVLGGNASSEVRLWALGATSHMGNNNRWAREGGVIDEILVENLWRNPEGNPIAFDALLLEKIVEQPRIRLLLNTAVDSIERNGPDLIERVSAYCSQNATRYEASAPLFCDASGDGIVAYLAGAAFRMGAEASDEFGERFAPTREYGELLGHSIYFISKDAGRPVRYTPPSFALRDINEIPRYRAFNTKDHGCRLWWIEYGGRLDTVHDTEAIKWKLWRVAYGVWDYIKNSGRFPEAESLTLEWLGAIPGKRESRRFEGPYMLRQSDIIEQSSFEDTVSYGGWSIDLHPADGIFSDQPGCNQWHSRGVYEIPYRCMFSRNIGNLFLAGRILSASHVAFGSTRVMLTCAQAAQATGMAAVLCRREGLRPADITGRDRMARLRRRLLQTGQHIPGARLNDPDDLVPSATLSASSEMTLSSLPPDGPVVPLDVSRAQMIPCTSGLVPSMTFRVDVREATSMRLELRTSDRPENHTPDILLAARDVILPAGGDQDVTVNFGVTLHDDRYLFACLMKNDRISVRLSESRMTGLLSVSHRGTQRPTEDIGVETFEFWTPARRPAGQNLAFTLDPPAAVFRAENVRNGVARPTSGPNAWVAAFDDPLPALTLEWPNPVTVSRIELAFDTDFDHPMETVWMGHPERVVPFCVKMLRIADETGATVAVVEENHQTRQTVVLPAPRRVKGLRVEILECWSEAPAALFSVRCYSSAVDR